MAKKKRLRPPSEKELRQLPYWAQVAFAARCARRVQPLFNAEWPEGSSEYGQGVEWAISLAETRAATGSAGDWRPAPGADAPAAVQAAFDAGCPTASQAAGAASYAASAPFHAALPVASDAASHATADAATSAAYAAGAVEDTRAEKGVVRAMRADFKKLKAAAKKEGWTDKTPVRPEFFGPLWPKGEPSGWPVGKA